MKRRSLAALFLLILGAAAGYYGILRQPEWDKLPSLEPAPRKVEADSRSWSMLLSADESGRPPECTAGNALLDPSVMLGCDRVHIRCDESETPGKAEGNGYCNPDCRIPLKSDSCSLLNLQPKQYDMVELRAALSQVQPRAFDEMWEVCAIAHQLRHARDGLVRPHCVFEFRGHWDQALCLQKFRTKFCSTPDAKLDAQECRRLDEGICYVEASRKLQTCRCENNVASNSACEQCRQSCNETLKTCYMNISPAEPPSADPVVSCEKLSGMYCKNSRFH